MSEIKFNENYWTPIPGYYPYEAYPTGEIRNCETKHILTPQKTGRDGRGCEQKYVKVCLSINGKSIHKKVHRLIALTFLPRPTGDIHDYDVDHLDHDPTHNSIMNLRWLPKKINRALQAGIKPEKYRKLVEEFYKTIK